MTRVYRLTPLHLDNRGRLRLQLLTNKNIEASGKVSEDNPTITADRVRDLSAKNTMMKGNHMMNKSTDSMMH